MTSPSDHYALGPALALIVVCPALAAQTIQFEPHVSYPTGSSGSWDVVAADFDGDSDLDLATANQWWHEVSVLFNDGTGVFGAPTNLPVGDLPHTLVAGNLDGNGLADIVVSGPASNVFSVIRNQGGGVFAAAQDFSGDGPLGVDLGDLDGDLDLDLAVTFGDTGLVRVLTNDGNGNFTFLPTSYPVGQTAWPIPSQVEIEDIDGDGDLDLLTTNSNEGTFSVLLNDGNAGFAPASTFVGSDKLAFGDLDGDGDLDLAYTDYWGLHAGVRFNQGNATFGPVVIVGALDFPVDVLIADLDNDGDGDLACLEGQNVAVFPNQGGGFFGSMMLFPCAIAPAGFTAADLNGDGLLDLAVADEAFPPDVTVLINVSTPPPCAIPTNYCLGAPNSVGPGASVSVMGSTSVANNDFILVVSDLPPGQPGIFYYGPTQVQTSFGDGYRCIGGPAGTVTRLFPIVQVGPTGFAGVQLDFTLPPIASGPGALTVGTPANFQFWYRDPGGFGGNFNLSDAVCVAFGP